jgi:hypothetical protein
VKQFRILQLEAITGFRVGQKRKVTNMPVNPQIQAFADKVKAFNDRQDAAIDDVQGDVTELKREIKELQDNPGTLSPEDQALLDSIQTRGEGISTKLEALAAQTPPPPPPPA